MQCKDIPTLPILLQLHAAFPQRYCLNFGGDCYDIRRSFPQGTATPPRLVLAKMAKLIKQGLVDGCACGCRGDYEITPKGHRFILEYSINHT